MSDKTNILPIENLAQFKRAIQLGVKVGGLHHMKFAGRELENNKVIYTEADLPVREVSHVQGNAFCLLTEKNGGLIDSWAYFPQASEVLIEEGVVTEFEKDLRQFAGGIMEEGNPDYDNLPLIPVISYWIEQ